MAKIKRKLFTFEHDEVVKEIEEAKARKAKREKEEALKAEVKITPPDNISDKLVKLYKEVSQSMVSFVNAMVIDKSTIVEPAAFHYDWSNLLLNAHKRIRGGYNNNQWIHTGNIAIEGFRESAKSSYFIYGYPLYCLTFPHKDRSYIVLIKSSDDMAKQKLKDIIDMYMSNKLLCSNIVKVHKKGEVFDVTTKEGVRMRIEAYGKGVNIRGLTWKTRRPDIIIMDDVQTVDDVNSELISERDWMWFMSDVAMAGKTSKIIMIGNNLGSRCIIEKLSQDPKRFRFKFLRIPAIDGDGRPTWKAKFDLDYLRKERLAYADIPEVWMRERMCQCVSEENRLFKKEYFRYYATLPQGKMNYYTAVDLAVSQKTKAHYSVILTLAINSDGIRFIERADYGRLTLDQLVDKLFEHIKQYKPIKVGVETIAFQAVMKQILQKEMLKRNAFFNIVELRPKGKKEDRIMSLQPLYSNNAIYHKQGADYITELETELLMFTPQGAKSERDDVVDALQMAVNISDSPIIRSNRNTLQRQAICL